MPLTLSLYGTNDKHTGTLIIDRNSLIFVYNKHHDDAFLCRNRLAHLFSTVENKFPEYKKAKVDFAMTEDPRHDALEHMCMYDRNNKHYHVIYQDDITFEMIKRLFSALDIRENNDLISVECIQDIIQISEKYFTTRSNDIEQAYREEKFRMLDKVFDPAKAEKTEDTKDTRSTESLILALDVLRMMHTGNHRPVMFSESLPKSDSSNKNDLQPIKLACPAI